MLESIVEAFDVEDGCDSGAAPLVGMVLGFEECGEDVLGGASPGGLVGRAALEFADVDGLVDVEGADDDDGHFGVEDLGQAVFDDEVLPVEARALELEAGAVGVDEGRLEFLVLEQVVAVHVDALSHDVVLVERPLLVLAGLLLDGVDVAERVLDFVELDDARDAVDGAEHLAELVQAQLDHVHPGGQVAQRREAPLHPELRDALLEQAGHRGFDLVGEAGLALLRQLEHGQRQGDCLAEFVDALEFLDEAVLERLAFLAVDADFVDLELAAGEVRRLVVGDFVADELDFLVDDLRGAAAPAAALFVVAPIAGVERQDVEQEVEHLVGREDARGGFGVGVHADRDGRLLLDALLDVLLLGGLRDQLRDFEREDLAVGLGHQFVLVDDLLDHDLVELGLAHEPVVVVDDVAALHDFAEQLLEVVPGDVGAG